MNRLVFLFMLLSTVGSCGKANDEKDMTDGYEFHDDFYYSDPSKMNKIYLEPNEGEYYLLFKSEFLDEVQVSLKENGFIIQPVYPYEISFWGSLETSDILENCMAVCIKGSGNIDRVSPIIYSGQLSTNDAGETCGTTNTLAVMLDRDLAESQYPIVLDYAKSLNIIPYDYIESSRYCFIEFACTNESRGNPVEISNWFNEVTDYFAEVLGVSTEWE